MAPWFALAVRSGSVQKRGMTATNPVPRLIDRGALRARQARALRLGPATFLLDRVAEDMQERLHAVLRDFKDAADIWTPGGNREPVVRDV